MPRGDKSAYTDKQKRKAEHIEESYEDRGVRMRKPSAAPGRPSTRKAVVATSPVPDAVALIPPFPPRKGDGKVAPPRPPARRNNDPHRPRRPPRHAGATGNARPDDRRPRKEADKGKSGAGEGNRTLVFSLGSCCSTIELHPRRALDRSLARRCQEALWGRKCLESFSPWAW